MAPGLHVQKYLSVVRFSKKQLTVAQQHLAQIQTRLDRHIDAFGTLKTIHDALLSPLLAQSIENLGPGST